MGVPHLTKLRDYLEKYAEESFSRTVLRNKLKQNYDTIKQNLAYLVNIEKVVIRVDGDTELYQWKKGSN